jgi:hypothetical protein
VRSMLTSTADVNAEAVGVGVTKCHNPQVFVTARIEMRASACKSVVYVACGFHSGKRGESGAMNVRGWWLAELFA